jgi:hypothetical protein
VGLAVPFPWGGRLNWGLEEMDVVTHSLELMRKHRNLVAIETLHLGWSFFNYGCCVLPFR